MNLARYFVRCRLAVGPHGSAPEEHGFDDTESWFAEAQAAIVAWAIEPPMLDNRFEHAIWIPRVIAVQIADTLAGCCEIAGELRIANLGRSTRTDDADVLGASRTTKLLGDLLLEQLTHLSHLVVNQVLYTVARHPRVRTIQLTDLETSKAGTTAAKWLRSPQGPIAKAGQGWEDRLDLNCSAETVKALGELARATGDKEMILYAKSLDTFLTAAWKELASVRGRRHHWLGGHVTPGLVNFPATQPRGGAMGTDGVSYFVEGGLHDPVAEANNALDHAVTTALAVLSEVGQQLSAFSEAWLRAMDHVSNPPETAPGTAVVPVPSANGECFPYRLRFWLAEPRDHAALMQKWFRNTDRPAIQGSSVAEVAEGTGHLMATVCATSFDEAVQTLHGWLLADGYPMGTAEARVIW